MDTPSPTTALRQCLEVLELVEKRDRDEPDRGVLTPDLWEQLDRAKGDAREALIVAGAMPARDVDEAQLARLAERGAVAWAGHPGPIKLIESDSEGGEPV